MRRAGITFLFLMAMLSNQAQTGFKQTQLSFSRVRAAYDEVGDSMVKMLSGLHLESGDIRLFIRVFKMEKEIEIWAGRTGEDEMKLLRKYPVCMTSGTLGPKRREGDLQIPEGFYFVEVFNPWSSYHLSMCINYPNPSDRKLGMQGNLGGNICIHGSCVTIGCIPLTDDIIKVVYLLCVEARNNGQENIPVTIFPARLTDSHYRMLTTMYDDYPDRINLWDDMKIAFDIFEDQHRLPRVSFLADGRHRID